MRAVVLVTLLAAILMASPAAAGDNATVRLSLAVAEASWGQSSCPPRVIIEDVPGGYVGHADLENCTITLAPRLLANRYMVCSVLVHEVGHLLGLPHSENSRSVMHEAMTYRPEACARFWLPRETYRAFRRLGWFAAP